MHQLIEMFLDPTRDELAITVKEMVKVWADSLHRNTDAQKTYPVLLSGGIISYILQELDLLPKVGRLVWLQNCPLPFEFLTSYSVFYTSFPLTLLSHVPLISPVLPVFKDPEHIYRVHDFCQPSRQIQTALKGPLLGREFSLDLPSALQLSVLDAVAARQEELLKKQQKEVSHTYIYTHIHTYTWTHIHIHTYAHVKLFHYYFPFVLRSSLVHNLFMLMWIYTAMLICNHFVLLYVYLYICVCVCVICVLPLRHNWLKKRRKKKRDKSNCNFELRVQQSRRNEQRKRLSSVKHWLTALPRRLKGMQNWNETLSERKRRQREKGIDLKENESSLNEKRRKQQRRWYGHSFMFASIRVICSHSLLTLTPIIRCSLYVTLTHSLIEPKPFPTCIHI